MNENIKETKQEVSIESFTIQNVLTTAQIQSMSKKELIKHIQYLERVALGLNHGLTVAVEQLNVKVRAKNGELV